LARVDPEIGRSVWVEPPAGHRPEPLVGVGDEAAVSSILLHT